jgi:hypothetical protein
MQTSDLAYFPDAEIEFRAVHYSTKEDFNLEIGDDFTYEADSMTDEEIKEWAENSGYLEPEYEFVDEDGYIDFDALREHKKVEEDEYPSNSGYPSGRAFDWFRDLGLKLPENLGVRVIDGAQPGNDWRGVIANNYAALKKLQDFLHFHSIKANFIIEFE